MTLALLSLFAFAAEFDQVDQVDSFRGCTIRIGRAEAGGVQPLRAECHWPDARIADVRRIVADWTKYEDIVDCMDDASCVREDGARELVWPRNEGAWHLAASADGGVDLVQDLLVDPGGRSRAGW